jgi:hypothetical protein
VCVCVCVNLLLSSFNHPHLLLVVFYHFEISTRCGSLDLLTRIQLYIIYIIYCTVTLVLIFVVLFSIVLENNTITTIQIPQTYMSHLNKQLAKDGGGSTNKPSGSDKTSRGGGDNASTTTGTTSKRSKNSSASANKSSASSSVSRTKTTSSRRMSESEASSGGGSKDSAPSVTPVVGLQFLNELYLCGNRIESLAGMEAYGTVSSFT